MFLGAVIAFAGTVAPSCGTPVRRCTAANCSGCCDDQGQCREGRSDTSCGINGEGCGSCSSTQLCSKVVADGGTDNGIGGRCTVKGAGGSGGTAGSAGGTSGGSGGTAGGAMDAGVCNATTCGDGCCRTDGVCERRQRRNACGKGGLACTSCMGATTCEGDAGTCVACNGCIDLAGTCQPGNTPMLCGATGNQCISCQTGQTCMNGQCMGSAGACTAATCPSGCCSGTMCIERAQQNVSVCGNSGNACNSCASDCDRDAGTCIGGTGGGTGTGGAGGIGLIGGTGGFGLIPMSCDSTNPCPAGSCCGAFGSCAQIGMSLGFLTVCGVGAGASECTACIMGQTCNMTSGACQ